MDLGLRDKVAVITGGSIGIGLAVAEGLAAEGANSCSPHDKANASTRRRSASLRNTASALCRSPATSRPRKAAMR